MKNAKIEFRCTEEEKKRAYDMAERHGQSVKDLMLGGTIYKRGRSGLNAREKASMQRMMTSLNKIDSGLDVTEETGKIIREARELCQYLKQ